MLECIATLCVMVLIGLIIEQIWRGRHYKRQQKEADQELQQVNAEIEEGRKKWQTRVAVAKRLLTGKSWRDPAGKKEFVYELYGGTPSYLWYAIGNAQMRASEETLAEIKDFFWGTKGPSFGDLEFHPSGHPEVGVALRIRNPQRFAEHVPVGDDIAHLYQTGHSMFGGPEAGCVSFVELYK